MKFNRQFTANYKGEKGEKHTMESMTKPNDSLSLRQLLINHTRNIPSNINVYPEIYTGDEVLPRPIDLTEILERREDLEAQVEELNKKIAEEKAAAKKAADEAKNKKGTPPPKSKEESSEDS